MNRYRFSANEKAPKPRKPRVTRHFKKGSRVRLRDGLDHFKGTIKRMTFADEDDQKKGRPDRVWVDWDFKPDHTMQALKPSELVWANE